MPAGRNVKFILKVLLPQKGSKFSVCGQQSFLVTTREKEVWSLCDVRGASEHKGIVFALVLAIPAAKDGPESAPL
jgi:hypothetical protein